MKGSLVRNNYYYLRSKFILPIVDFHRMKKILFFVPINSFGFGDISMRKYSSKSPSFLK